MAIIIVAFLIGCGGTQHTPTPCPVDKAAPPAPEKPKIDPAEEKAITATILDYFEGWFDGDAVRMERALYPTLAKRGYRMGKPINEVTAKEMVDDTKAGEGKKNRPPELGIVVRVDDLYNDIATVTVYSAVFIEYCHLIKTETGWKILNTVYTKATKK